MTGFRARRSAEEFDRSIEALSSGSSGDPRHADLLDLVGALRSTAPVEPRPDFVSDLRRQLMTEAQSVSATTNAKLSLAPRTRSTRERRIAIAVGGFAVVSATTSMAMAAQSALPGDTLYPLKRALENVTTTIQVDQDDRASSLLDHATGRLEEAEALTRSDHADDSLAVSETLHSFTAQASTASDLMLSSYEPGGQTASLERLRVFTTDSMSLLRGLERVVPESARPALIEAAQVITQIDVSAATLCPACGRGVGEIPVAATTALDSLLDELGEQVPTTPSEGPARGDKPGRSGRDPQGGNATTEPAPDVTVPDVAVDTGAAGSATDEAQAPSTGAGDRARNPLEPLRDGLTGGRQVRGPHGAGGRIGDVLEDTVDTVDDLLGGVLGG